MPVAFAPITDWLPAIALRHAQVNMSGTFGYCANSDNDVCITFDFCSRQFWQAFATRRRFRPGSRPALEDAGLPGAVFVGG